MTPCSSRSWARGAKAPAEMNRPAFVKPAMEPSVLIRAELSGSQPSQTVRRLAAGLRDMTRISVPASGLWEASVAGLALT